MRILIINGPNLNMLGKRDPEKSGSFSLEDLQNKIINEYPEHDFEFYQSNIEGEIVSKIQYSQNNFNGLIINAGGYTHTSVAIKDALEIMYLYQIPFDL